MRSKESILRLGEKTQQRDCRGNTSKRRKILLPGKGSSGKKSIQNDKLFTSAQ